MNDLKFAIRQLVKRPGFTAVAVLTLALGIGANTAMFSVVNGVVLRPLPYPEPERVGYIGWDRGSFDNTFLSAYKYDYFRRHTRVFDGVATYGGWATEIGEGRIRDEVRGLRASGSFFRVAAIEPVLGRPFLPEEDRRGAAAVVVLGHDLWVSRFRADPDVLGQTVRLGGEPHTVVGVMPDRFRLPDLAEFTDFIVPHGLDPDPRDRGMNYLAWARMRPNVTGAQVEADLRSVSEQFRREHPELMGDREVGGRFIGFNDVFVGGTADTLWILLGAVGFVLLIACANVANLLLARATGRKREIAIRAAVGASRGRIVRQLLTESLLLAVVAAVLGLVMGQWTLDSLLALAPSSLPRAEEIGLDVRVLAFTAAIAIGTGILFGLTAASHGAGADLDRSLRDSERRSTPERGRNRVRRVLVASEATLAVVLLAGAGLLVMSFYRLRAVDPGMDPAGVLAVEFRRTPERYAAQDVWRFEEEVIERVRAVPGVTAAAAISTLPLSGHQYNFPMTVVGEPDATAGAALWSAVSPTLFETLRIRLRSGRHFSGSDGPGSPPVVIINETFARKYFEGRRPIGQRIDIGTYRGEEVIPGFDEPEREIVGVVADVRALGLSREGAETMYIPRAQASGGIGSLGALVVRAGRSSALASVVLEEIRAVDPQMPLPVFRPMTEVIGASIAQQRFHAVLFGAFAGLALVLTAIGIYGLVAYTVRQRTGEIGIRMALGADRGDVLALVVRQGMVPVGLGLGIGLLAAVALARLISALLYGVSPNDPRVFAAVAAVLAVIALLATYLPARRAARSDPMEALRYE